MPQPSAEKITTCIEQMATLAQDAGNQQDMLVAEEQAAGIVTQDLADYHYCYYQMMARLDDRLNRAGQSLDQLGEVFLVDMKTLWILSRGLDTATGRDQYFAFLQDRYVQLSADIFGRDVEVVGPPMGALRYGASTAPAKAISGGKSAAEAQAP